LRYQLVLKKKRKQNKIYCYKIKNKKKKKKAEIKKWGGKVTVLEFFVGSYREVLKLYCSKNSMLSNLSFLTFFFFSFIQS